MNRSLHSFLFVCRCLSRDTSQAALSALRRDIVSGAVGWHEVVAIANRHFVTPALWVALRNKELADRLPDDLRDFLKEVHGLNVTRNAKLREETLMVTAGLNEAGVVPVVLKGGVHLFEFAFGDPGARMMRDLDILVPMNKFDDSLIVLDSLGFQTAQDSNEWMNSHSFPPVFRPGGIVPIELHKNVGPQKRIVDVEAAFRDAVPVNADGLKLLALSPTHQVIHNFFHAQIQDRFHELGFISLKQIHGLLTICERNGGDVDWKAIRETMEQHGFGPALASYVHLATRLFGLPVQTQIPQTLRARLHLRRCLVQIRWSSLMSLFSIWGAATMPLKWTLINYKYNCKGKWHLVNLHRVVSLYKYFSSKKFDRELSAKIRGRRDTHYDFN